MKKITSIDELMNELENGEYNYYGLRGASEHDLEVADRGYLDCSYDAFQTENRDDLENNEMLNGTCAIDVSEYCSEKEIMRKYNLAKNYAKADRTNTVYLLGDSNSEYGTDDEEVILGSNGYGADVIAIVEF